MNPSHVLPTLSLGLEGKTAVVTGAGGAICGAIARSMARAGAAVSVWDVDRERAHQTAAAIIGSGGSSIAVACDATRSAAVEEATERTLAALGAIDILVNGAGGSRKETTTSDELRFFDIEPDDMMRVVSLNYLSAVVPSQAVGRVFATQGRGVILNIASVAGLLPLTRAVAYSNGKAATVSFTQWLAVHMAQSYSPAIRVNAIAPGFVLTEQNRFLLVDEATSAATERGKQILRSVPMGRYGIPEDMVGTALWLVSDAAAFVTGAVVPVDGGFQAFSGV